VKAEKLGAHLYRILALLAYHAPFVSALKFPRVICMAKVRKLGDDHFALAASCHSVRSGVHSGRRILLVLMVTNWHLDSAVLMLES